jgi:2-dehydropantoate 2-reductase
MPSDRPRPSPHRLLGLLGGVGLAGIVATAFVHQQRQKAQRHARNQTVQIAVLGAGVVGSTYALHLAKAGMAVTLMARGGRYVALRDRGLMVRDLLTRRRLRWAQCPTPVRVVSALPHGAAFDLIIVAIRSTQIMDMLDTLKSLDPTTPVLFIQSDPGIVGALVQALGEPSVLLGFPATGGSRTQDTVYSLPLWTGATLLGESDGSSTPRLRQAAAVLRHAGLKVEIQRQMLPWLRTHAAMLVALAGVVRRNGGVRAMARDSGEIMLYLGALREALTVLEAGGTPITPATHKAALQGPRWLQRLLVRAASLPYWVETVVDDMVRSSDDELRRAHAHLLTLAQEAGMETPLLTFLAPHDIEV